MQMQTQPIPAALVGSFRRFGADGPAYEIVSLAEEPAAARDQENIWLKVRVIDTGESLRYSYRDALADPEA